MSVDEHEGSCERYPRGWFRTGLSGQGTRRAALSRDLADFWHGIEIRKEKKRRRF